MERPERSGSSDPLGRKPTMAGAEYMGLGLQFGLSIVGFMFLGRWLDGVLGTTPWLMVLGVFLGAGAAFYVIYRRLMADQRRQDAAKRAARAEREARSDGEGGRAGR